jgi:hypothetical protein
VIIDPWVSACHIRPALVRLCQCRNSRLGVVGILVNKLDKLYIFIIYKTKKRVIYIFKGLAKGGAKPSM